MTTTTDDKKAGFSVKDLKQIFGGSVSNGRQFGILAALIVIVLFFQIVTGGLTLSPGNLINLVQQYSYILILAIGMVMVIIAGHIDLSVGSVAAFTGIVVALAMRDLNLPWYLGIVLGLLIGAAIGAWQGFWVAYVGVPAFIVTLAGMLIWRGGNQYIGGATAVPVPSEFYVIGAGYLPDFTANDPFNYLTIILGVAIAAVVVFNEFRGRRLRRVMGAEPAPLWVSLVRVAILVALILVAAWLFATGRPGTSFPVSGIILGVLVVFYSFLTRSTIFGRHIYAVGGNRHAAALSGVKSRRTDFLIMMNMSILAALAGMIYIARAQASGGQDGNGWELDAIAAVFIGGAAVAGGIGTVAGSIIGGLVMAVLNNGLILIGTGADLVQIIKGLVLLIAVGVDVYNKSQGRVSIIGFLMKGMGGRSKTADALPDANETVRPEGSLPK